MLSKTCSASYLGIDAYPVEIEVDVANGLPQISIVGLPDQAVKESKERVRSALRNSGFSIAPKKITINLAPADLKKEGPAFDLAIAVGILASGGFVKKDLLHKTLLLGELALDGSLRFVKGALPAAHLARRMNQTLVLPDSNTHEAGLAEEVTILAASNLKQVVDWLNGETILKGVKPSWPNQEWTKEESDFAEIKGQFHAKRAAEIAASGMHNLIMIGPPGGGKTMIAKRIPSILPDLSRKEYLEIAKIYSVAGLMTHESPYHLRRPFRMPHHTISQIGLVGGGSFPRPGEITLAHRGVLFLDEFPEFRRDAIESLRAPIEDGCILISRAKNHIAFPAQFLTVCAMNPCPCGFLTSSKKACRCNMGQIQRYIQKISGPILDRMDLHVEMPSIDYGELTSQANEEGSTDIRKRVLQTRQIQSERFKGNESKTNALMSSKEIKKYCALDGSAKKLLEAAMKELELSARGFYKILKVARTIADIVESEFIKEEHVAEAIQFRSLDRNWFG